MVHQSDVPLKPKEEFSIELNYTFKERPISDRAPTYENKDTKVDRDRNTGPLPHLGLKVKFLKLGDEEVRVKAVNTFDRIMLTRKLEVNEMFLVDVGFMDDIKDRMPGATYEFNIYTVSAKKKELGRIHVLIQEDGTFLVNGEKRGKF
jgi:hypothetical protein